MKINIIRLHPFAGIPDRTIRLKDGINTMLGENEFGKSTIFNAISAALFIPERPRKGSDDHKSIERCFPNSGGSEIRVTLTFEAEGQRHILHKTWSRNPKLSHVRLGSGGRELIGEEAEAEMVRLLRLNRSSWENMLFIEQSSIHDTIGRLKQRMDSLDTVQSFLKDADPFDREAFVRAVSERLKRHESRWDTALQRPEGGRGIDNKWARDVGSILEAWYEKEGFRARQQYILETEMQVEELNRRIHDVTPEKEALEAFIRLGKPLLKDAHRSLSISSEKRDIETKGKELKAIPKDWASAEALLPGKREELDRLQAERRELETELGHANRRSSAADLLRRESAVRSLEVRINELKSGIDGMPEIPEAVVKEVNACEGAVRDARLRLEAQRLKASLESDSELQVHATIGGEQPQIITVRAGMTETLESPGSISIAYGPLSLRVVSGNEDVDRLQEAVLKQQQRIRERCSEHGADDIEGLRGMRSRLLEFRSLLERLERDLKAQLGGKELAQWKQELAALADIPATRDISVIQGELNRRGHRVAELGLEISGLEGNLARWQREHGSLEDLLEKVTDLRSQWKRLDEEASTLKSLPEGYDSPARFIDTLQHSQDRLDRLQGDLAGFMEERARLQGKLSSQEFSAEELSEKHQSAESRYEHLLREVKSLRRILDVHETVISEKESDPFIRVGARIVQLLERLSEGRYGQVQFEKNLPETIGSDNIRLETDLLSKGMKGSLALAVRMAYSEVYLSDMDGFLMLDDPFTELDPDRRRHAAELLQEMANGKQIIFFTCHPEQAGLFPAMSAVACEDIPVGP
jgi:exonuclease SbcC